MRDAGREQGKDYEGQNQNDAYRRQEIVAGGATERNGGGGQARSLQGAQAAYELSILLCRRVLKRPYLKVEFAVTIDQFKIDPVGRDQSGTAGAHAERDQYVEVQVA